MSIQKILAVSGKPGLYELKIQTRTGFVAESLLDGKKITVGMRANVSLLSEIAVFTYSEEVRLADVLKAIATKEEVELAIERNKPDKVMMKRANPGLKQIVELLGTKGITEKDAILAAVRGLVSREISSSSDLTDDEIALIIKHLAVVES